VNEPGAGRWRWSNLSYERRLTLLSLLAGFPGAVIALLLIWTGDFSLKLQITVTLFVVLAWLGASTALRNRVVYPLRTLANLLEALREGDYSLRAREPGHQDAMSEVLWEVNTLRDTLQRQRMGAVEATALLKRVMEEIDVAVFTFDEEGKLRLVNRAGERILAQPARRLLGRSAEEVGLAACLEGEPSRTFQAVFPGREGRWSMRRGVFREEGKPHHLLVITDLSKTLREEERQAWRRLIRVIGHELNNSLTPIKSMTATLVSMLSREPRPEDLEEDLTAGLRVIGERSDALIRFMASYSRLARLPSPQRKSLPVAPLVERVAALETRLPVEVEPGPEVTVHADGDQLEQLLINLVRNATDAALETGGGVRVSWRTDAGSVEIRVEDEGPGLSNPENLFVPFYTTKPGGTGIGLVLSRQIAEAHGGSLRVRNRRGRHGCEARLRLPL
jgi:two-component system nitrogen regulation sensor histidine kinase NtrY